MGHLLYDGKILKIGEVQTFSSNFKKREFVVIEEVEKYAQEIKFEFVGDQVDVLDSYKEGDAVTVAFLLRGNEYQDKHYVSLKAIAIGERISDDNPLREVTASKVKTKPVQTYAEPSEDDLPF
jgi:hypothetical protein